MSRTMTLLLVPVLALALAGCPEGAPTATAAGSGTGGTGGTGGSGGPAADTTQPTIPTGVVAVANGSAGVNLSWNASTDNVGVTGYIVRRNGSQVATPTTTSYADTGLAAATPYNYTVAARDAAGNVSPSSAVASATTAPGGGADTTAPTLPGPLSATPIDANTIALGWTASTDNVGVVGYVVRRNGAQVGIATTNSYTDSCLSASTNFTYTVSAFDAAGNTSAQTAGAPAMTQASGAPTALAQLAASLASGGWAAFTMGGLDSSLVFAAGPSTNSLLTFAARGHWDCAHKKLQYAGTSHTGGLNVAGAGGLITWDDATNQWTKESYTWSSENPGHNYYHVALNKTNGDLYFRGYNSSGVRRRAFGSTGQNSWQTGQVANHPNAANQVAGGLEWFPQLNGGLGGLVFVDAAGAAWSNAALSSWTQQNGQSGSGNYHTWVANAGGFIYWGGGNGSSAMHRLSPTGIVAAMPSTPLAAGTNNENSIVLPHPNGTDLLLFSTASGGAIHRFNGTGWSSAGTHQLGGQLWVGFTIPEYGVILFLRHENNGNGNGSAIVFKP